MWKIYDELIELVPKDLIIKDFVAGLNWLLVESIGTGMAMTPREGMSVIPMAGNVVGMKAYEVAKLIKSWNNYEAALGLAVINSVINVGPSTPMTDCLYKYGVNMLASTVVTDRNRVWNLIKQGGGSEFFNNGALMVKMDQKGEIRGGEF